MMMLSGELFVVSVPYLVRSHAVLGHCLAGEASEEPLRVLVMRHVRVGGAGEQQQGY